MNQPLRSNEKPAVISETETPLIDAGAAADANSKNLDRPVSDQEVIGDGRREEAVEELVKSEVHRMQKRWCLGCGTGILLILVIAFAGFVMLIQKGMNEVKLMGPWPDSSVSPEELVDVDLSDLGLKAVQIQNARDREEWAGGIFQDGVVAPYVSKGESVVYLWVLRYEDEEAASNDYASIQVWSSNDCGKSIYAYYGYSGIVDCQYSDAFIKTIWNEGWIVQIVALDGTKYTPDVLVDKVRDAVAVHWKELTPP